MLKPGIKIGPKDWRNKLDRSKASFCEVWYRVDKPNLYQSMFSYLKKHSITTGLHFWAAINNQYLPNIAYPHPDILDPTLELIQKNIDIAAQNNFNYVNIHAGNLKVLTADFEKQSLLPTSKYPQISLKLAQTTQEQSINNLHQYAQSKGVLLLTETIPAKDSPRWYDLKARIKPIKLYSLPVSSLINLAQKGCYVTNDICHTFCDEYDQPLKYLWRQLYRKSKILASQTKLLHISTLIPPYNGSDTHHGITDNDFKIKGIFPTRPKLIKILRLFKDRDDVLAINEPRNNHIANYFALKKLLTEI